MSFTFVRGAGNSVEPAAIHMYASGVVHPGGVVFFDETKNAVAAGAANSTTTNIVGVALDYAQGYSDTMVRVLPFAQGQIWQADCANAISTASIGLRHQLASDTVLRNVTSISESVSTGIFLVYNVTGLTTGSGKVLGTFLQRPSFLGKDGVTATT